MLTKQFYDERWEWGNIPIKLRGTRLDGYQPISKSGEMALMEAQAFVEDFEYHYVSKKRAANGEIPDDRSTIGKGLMFYGHNGTRKTSLAVGILTELQYKYGYPQKGYYIRFSDWKRCLTDTFTKDNTERTGIARASLLKAEHSPLLVLDDIGQEHRTSSGFTESSLHELLRVRYEAARPTIVTTNIDPIQMRQTYGDSFESFRHDAFTTLPMLGKDSRLLKDS